MADVAMPRLSDSMEEGTILKWLKSDGDEVSKGDELVEIETDKANMTYEADSDGVLEIVAQEGDSLPVGETIARLGSGGGGSKDDEGGEEKDEDEAKAESDEDEDEAKGEDDEDESDEDEDEAKGEDDERKAEGEGDEEKDEGKGDEGDAKAEEEDEAKAEGEDEAKGEAESEGEDGGDDAEAAARSDQDSGDDDSDGRREERPEPAAAPAGKGDGDGDGNGRVKASPVARRMAREMGVELATLEGTGPGGRIVKADVEAAARGDGAPTEAPEEERGKAEKEEAKDEKPEKAPPPVVSGEQGRGDTETQELTRLQRTVARRMAESKATAPDFVITVEVDMEEAVEFRKQLKAAAGDAPAPSFNDLVVKACALALRDFPRANGAYRDGKFELYSRVNVGVAVAGLDALVVPTVFDADKKSLGAIARESRALAERVRAAEITPPELSGGTFTVSNLGMYGIKRFVAVINPPQAAILAVGELTPRPVVRDGEVQVRSVMELTLSCDHRILYGADAAQFLARIREYLEQPLRLTL
jgi:pyruvate dehydrogenase E2 component (dihydrolipoyllysine-residue acetyltransferase)